MWGKFYNICLYSFLNAVNDTTFYLFFYHLLLLINCFCMHSIAHQTIYLPYFPYGPHSENKISGPLKITSGTRNEFPIEGQIRVFLK